MSALALTALTSCAGKANWYTPGTPMKIGLICLHDEASTYDKNFIDAFKAAGDAAKAAGTVSEYIIKTGVEESQACGDAAKQLVNQGCNVIFTDSFGHDEYLYQAAKDNPQVVFSSATGVKAYNGAVQNYHNAFASIYEGRYLAGYAAGKYMITNDKQKKKMDDEMTKETHPGKFYVGYVGAFDYAEVISGYTSWFLGLKEGLYDDKGSSEEEKEKYQKALNMYVKYTNSWYDENGEYATANTLIGKDCILLSQHADSMGAPRACDEKHIPNVSYNMDTVKMAGEEYKDTFISYSKVNWAPYYTQVINDTFEGRVIKGETDRNWTGTLETDSVQYDVNEDLKDIKTATEAEKALLQNKTKYVFDTSKFTITKDAPRNKEKNITVENGKLTHYYSDITGDYAPDEFEMVNDKGYVMESHYRSAPSFDLTIDNIEVLE